MISSEDLQATRRRDVHKDPAYLAKMAERAGAEDLLAPVQVIVEPKRNYNSRRVIMKDRARSVIRTFDSIHDTARIMKVSYGGIYFLITQGNHQRGTGNTFEFEPRHRHPTGGMKSPRVSRKGK